MNNTTLHNIAHKLLNQACQRLIERSNDLLPTRFYTVEEQNGTTHIDSSCDLHYDVVLKIVAEAITMLIAEPDNTILATFKVGPAIGASKRHMVLVTADSPLAPFIMYRYYSNGGTRLVLQETVTSDSTPDDHEILSIDEPALHFFDTVRAMPAVVH